MIAESYRIGKRFQNKNTLEIVIVDTHEIDNYETKYFIGSDWGDMYEFLDEDLFNDLDYYDEIKRE